MEGCWRGLSRSASFLSRSVLPRQSIPVARFASDFRLGRTPQELPLSQLRRGPSIHLHIKTAQNRQEHFESCLKLQRPHSRRFHSPSLVPPGSDLTSKDPAKMAVNDRDVLPDT